MHPSFFSLIRSVKNCPGLLYINKITNTINAAIRAKERLAELLYSDKIIANIYDIFKLQQ